MASYNKTITLSDKNGNSYKFELFTMNQSFNSVKAIYIVWKLTDNNTKYSLFYIGQTDDLSTRFDNHHKQDCFDKKWANFIGVHQVTTQADRYRIEKALIEAHRPPCNEMLK